MKKIIIIVIILNIFFSAYSSWIIKTNTIKIKIKNLPKEFENFKILHISDIHAGKSVDNKYIKKAVIKCLKLKPDIIVITGDHVSWKDEYINPCIQELSYLEAKHGVYAVLGNHDYMINTKRLISKFQETDINLLINSNKKITIKKDTIYIAGIDDILSGNPSLNKTLKNIPQEAVTILLCHEPDFADTASKYNINLQLSGHSHGGQVYMPLLIEPIFPYMGRKYTRGLYKIGKMYLYTNIGLGVIEPAVRMNCPPEITVIILKKK